MQLARFVRTLGLLLVLSLVAFVVGCGAQQGPTAVTKEAAKITREETKSIHQQLKEDRAASGKNANRKPARDRPPSGN